METDSILLENLTIRYNYEEVKTKMLEFIAKDDTIAFTLDNKDYEYKITDFSLVKPERRFELLNHVFIFKFVENEFIKFDEWFTKVLTKKETTNLSNIKEHELFKKAFENPFIESKKYVFNKLKQHIETCVTEWKNKNIYSPIVVICQSSGYGKSRCLYEYASLNITTFICLRDMDTNGFPPRSKLASEFIDLLKEIPTNNRFNLKPIEKFLFALVQTSIEFYELITQHNPNMRKNNIPLEFRKYQPWLDNQQIEFIKKDNTKILFADRVLELTKNITLLDSQNLKNKINKKFKFLTIAIDEAHVITKYYNEEKSLFRYLRSIIRELFEDFNIVFVMTSTNASLVNFSLNKNQYTNSQRTSKSSNIYLPFCELVFCDQLKSSVYCSDFKRAYYKNFYEFIINRDPKNTIFYFGRPFWASINEAKNEIRSDEDIIKLAKTKLIRAENWSDQMYKDYASLAILASRTTLLSNVGILNYDFVSNLIAGFMATLFHIDKDCNVLLIRYVSEPILAEAAAIHMSENLNEILQNLYLVLSSINLISTGGIGELVAELVMLITHDLAIRKENLNDISICYSKSIYVSSFVEELIGKQNYQRLDLKDLKIMKGILAFNHFNQKIDVLKQTHLINHFIKRCAAGRFKENFPNFDYFLPVVMNDNKIGMILLQIKNKINLNTVASLENKARDKMSFDVFEKTTSSKLYTDLVVNEQDTFKILMSFGSDLEHISYTHNTLIISNVNSLNIKQDTKEILKMLLNISRNDIKQSVDKNIAQLVTLGCVDNNYYSI